MKLLLECKDAKRIGISGHIRPDGDCVGSCLALYRYLKKELPENTFIKVYLDHPPGIFRELWGFDEIESAYPEEDVFDVFFALDCNKDRLGEAQNYFDKAKKTINIDHHVSNTGSGDLNCMMPQIGSVSEVLYGLLVAESGEGALDCEIAKSIYTGIIHDTGVFQFSNTTPETLRIAAKLVEYGFDFSKLIAETFYQKSYLQTQVLGRALMESIRFMDGNCIVSCIEKRQMEFYGATTHDFDGIVNQLLNIKGVHCAIFMYQTDVMEYKVSMRSDEYVDVAKVVSHFGGGGHVRAAGCTMNGTFHDCVNNLSLHIEMQLKAKQQV